ncbi:hypothetical protein ScPMuIL_009287 [Solemya velum]
MDVSKRFGYLAVLCFISIFVTLGQAETGETRGKVIYGTSFGNHQTFERKEDISEANSNFEGGNGKTKAGGRLEKRSRGSHEDHIKDLLLELSSRRSGTPQHDTRHNHHARGHNSHLERQQPSAHMKSRGQADKIHRKLEFGGDRVRSSNQNQGSHSEEGVHNVGHTNKVVSETTKVKEDSRYGYTSGTHGAQHNAVGGAPSRTAIKGGRLENHKTNPDHRDILGKDFSHVNGEVEKLGGDVTTIDYVGRRVAVGHVHSEHPVVTDSPPTIEHTVAPIRAVQDDQHRGAITEQRTTDGGSHIVASIGDDQDGKYRGTSAEQRETDKGSRNGNSHDISGNISTENATLLNDKEGSEDVGDNGDSVGQNGKIDSVHGDDTMDIENTNLGHAKISRKDDFLDLEAFLQTGNRHGGASTDDYNDIHDGLVNPEKDNESVDIENSDIDTEEDSNSSSTRTGDNLSDDGAENNPVKHGAENDAIASVKENDSVEIGAENDSTDTAIVSEDTFHPVSYSGKSHDRDNVAEASLKIQQEVKRKVSLLLQLLNVTKQDMDNMTIFSREAAQTILSQPRGLNVSGLSAKMTTNLLRAMFNTTHRTSEKAVLGSISPLSRQTASVVWTTWGDWTQCSVTCGSGGIRQRTRHCETTGACSGTYVQVDHCHQREECESHVDCLSSPCRNGAPCVDVDYKHRAGIRPGFICHCTSQYEGATCQHRKPFPTSLYVAIWLSVGLALLTIAFPVVCCWYFRPTQQDLSSPQDKQKLKARNEGCCKTGHESGDFEMKRDPKRDRKLKKGQEQKAFTKRSERGRKPPVMSARVLNGSIVTDDTSLVEVTEEEYAELENDAYLHNAEASSLLGSSLVCDISDGDPRSDVSGDYHSLLVDSDGTSEPNSPSPKPFLTSTPVKPRVVGKSPQTPDNSDRKLTVLTPGEVPHSPGYAGTHNKQHPSSDRRVRFSGDNQGSCVNDENFYETEDPYFSFGEVDYYHCTGLEPSQPGDRQNRQEGTMGSIENSQIGIPTFGTTHGDADRPNRLSDIMEELHGIESPTKRECEETNDFSRDSQQSNGGTCSLNRTRDTPTLPTFTAANPSLVSPTSWSHGVRTSLANDGVTGGESRSLYNSENGVLLDFQTGVPLYQKTTTFNYITHSPTSTQTTANYQGKGNTPSDRSGATNTLSYPQGSPFITASDRSGATNTPSYPQGSPFITASGRSGATNTQSFPQGSPLYTASDRSGATNTLSYPQGSPFITASDRSGATNTPSYPQGSPLNTASDRSGATNTPSYPQGSPLNTPSGRSGATNTPFYPQGSQPNTASGRSGATNTPFYPQDSPLNTASDRSGATNTPSYPQGSPLNTPSARSGATNTPIYPQGSQPNTASGRSGATNISSYPQGAPPNTAFDRSGTTNSPSFPQGSPLYTASDRSRATNTQSYPQGSPLRNEAFSQDLMRQAREPIHCSTLRGINCAPLRASRHTQTSTNRIVPSVPLRSESEHYLDDNSRLAWSTTGEEGLSDNMSERLPSSPSISPRQSPEKGSPEYYQMVYGTPCYKS